MPETWTDQQGSKYEIEDGQILGRRCVKITRVVSVGGLMGPRWHRGQLVYPDGEADGEGYAGGVAYGAWSVQWLRRGEELPAIECFDDEREARNRARDLFLEQCRTDKRFCFYTAKGYEPVDDMDYDGYVDDRLKLSQTADSPIRVEIHDPNGHNMLWESEPEARA